MSDEKIVKIMADYIYEQEKILIESQVPIDQKIKKDIVNLILNKLEKEVPNEDN